MAQDWGH